MRDDVVAIGIVLWIIAFFAVIGGAAAGILGLLGGALIAGFLGLVGFVLIIAGLVSPSPTRACYVCGMVLTSSGDYDRHMAAMHPGGRPSNYDGVPGYGLRAQPQVAQMAYCGNCGQMLRSTDLFCPRCGQRKASG